MDTLDVNNKNPRIDWKGFILHLSMGEEDVRCEIASLYPIYRSTSRYDDDLALRPGIHSRTIEARRWRFCKSGFGSATVDQNLILDTNGNLSLSHQGKEAIAKIWSIHELTERLVFEDIPDEEKAVFIKTLKKIQSNCEKVTPYEA